MRPAPSAGPGRSCQVAGHGDLGPQREPGSDVGNGAVDRGDVSEMQGLAAVPGVGHSDIGRLQPTVHPVEDRLGTLNTHGEVRAERFVRDAWEAEHLGDLPG